MNHKMESPDSTIVSPVHGFLSLDFFHTIFIDLQTHHHKGSVYKESFL